MTKSFSLKIFSSFSAESLKFSSSKAGVWDFLAFARPILQFFVVILCFAWVKWARHEIIAKWNQTSMIFFYTIIWQLFLWRLYEQIEKCTYLRFWFNAQIDKCTFCNLMEIGKVEIQWTNWKSICHSSLSTYVELHKHFMKQSLSFIV